jgi:membrane protease subunit (stomatin/prohibitin family)
MSGWAKAAWTLFVIVLPFLGVMVYLIARGSEMAERRDRDISQMLDRGNAQYAATATAHQGSAAEIAEAKKLLDSGAIDEAEFAQLKTNVLY